MTLSKRRPWSGSLKFPSVSVSMGSISMGSTSTGSTGSTGSSGEKSSSEGVPVNSKGGEAESKMGSTKNPSLSEADFFGMSELSGVEEGSSVRSISVLSACTRGWATEFCNGGNGIPSDESLPLVIQAPQLGSNTIANNTAIGNTQGRCVCQAEEVIARGSIGRGVNDVGG